MHTPTNTQGCAQDTNPSPSVETVRDLVLEIAPLLMRQGLNITVGRDGSVEVQNPRDTRMKQPLVLREHQVSIWWHWVWSGPTGDAPPEYEPMVPANDVDEAARRIINVLLLDEPAGAER
ncbi:hypothetical protein [Actinoallomurus sp. NPDC050550]|uniref:hypothetical protein n=1 Tax=Actinoallomurus sp. NPDC050550 TaxID=3154937 RepID=UPI0033CC6399